MCVFVVRVRRRPFFFFFCLKWKLNVQVKQMEADSVCLKLLFLVFACPGRQVKSALITNVRDSIKHEESK